MDWSRIGIGMVMDWRIGEQICLGFSSDCWIGDGLVDWSNMGIRLLDW